MTTQISISLIIPTFNEAENLIRLLPYLQEYGGALLREIIVVDGHSSDDSVQIAKEMGAKHVLQTTASRAMQMNEGAKMATGNVLYFVHADTVPPKSYASDIADAMEEGFAIGCYRFRFDSSSKMLQINAWFTRFDRQMCRGGDQSLFVTQQLFHALQGFNNEFIIMEDYEFIRRARAEHSFKIIPKEITVSARKYQNNSYLRVNLSNLFVFMLYRWGAPPNYLYRVYMRLIKHPKDLRRMGV